MRMRTAGDVKNSQWHVKQLHLISIKSKQKFSRVLIGLAGAL